jgi:hypothetical protein
MKNTYYGCPEAIEQETHFCAFRHLSFIQRFILNLYMRRRKNINVAIETKRVCQFCACIPVSAGMVLHCVEQQWISTGAK